MSGNVKSYRTSFGWTYEEAVCTACHTVVSRYRGLPKISVTAWRGVEDDTVICKFSRTGNHTIQLQPRKV